jgi:hypothetical protein
MNETRPVDLSIGSTNLKFEGERRLCPSSLDVLVDEALGKVGFFFTLLGNGL